jgi:hypothetical protein
MTSPKDRTFFYIERIRKRWAHARRVDAGTHWADEMPSTAIADVKALLAEVDRLTRELVIAEKMLTSGNAADARLGLRIAILPERERTENATFADTGKP